MHQLLKNEHWKKIEPHASENNTGYKYSQPFLPLHMESLIA